MASKKEVYYWKMAQSWDNQCYALTREQVVQIYGKENVSKDYKQCKEIPIKEGK